MFSPFLPPPLFLSLSPRILHRVAAASSKADIFPIRVPRSAFFFLCSSLQPSVRPSMDAERGKSPSTIYLACYHALNSTAAEREAMWDAASFCFNGLLLLLLLLLLHVRHVFAHWISQPEKLKVKEREREANRGKKGEKKRSNCCVSGLLATRVHATEM
jgi:hypothetical protein